MVTSPHALASEAGAAVLRAGGNALEAAIAIGSTIAVVYPHFCGLGGDAIWMVADRSGRRSCFLGIGQAAGEPPEFKGAIPVRGPMSMLTTACAVDSWRHAHAYSARHWGGTIPFADLLASAIRYAHDGFPVTRSQSFWLDFRKTEAGGWPGFADIFMPGGRSPAIGELFRQEHLARSLDLIARDGPRSFYEGELGARVAAGLHAAGSPLTAADLAATHTREVAPESLAYRGFELLAPPPPTQGISTLAIMGILAHFDMASLSPGGTDHIHLCVEAVKRAFLDRSGIADPDFAPQPVADWLAPDHLRDAAGSIAMDSALEWPAPLRTGDTVFFAAADAEGSCVSVLQSTYFDWGSGTVVGDTGILWQNRGAAFSLDPTHPNAFQPGKRPFYTLNPGLGLREGRPALLYGTQGADGQPQTLSMILSRHIDFGQEPAKALAGPRFLLGKTFSDSRDSLKLERDAGQDVFAGLEARGHAIAPIEAQSPLAGLAGLISIDGHGTMRGAHDPRGDGVALSADAPPQD
ncbi:gamma-glutamyltransferase family protein [Labrys miyagiensis]